MNLKLLKRRVEMLDTVSKGFHPSKVIEQLAEEYDVSEQCLWSDWMRRETWMPTVLSLDKYAGFVESVESKLNAVQKAAWTTYSRASNDNVKVGALKILLESLELGSSTVLSKEIIQRLEHVEELADKKDAKRFES